MSRVSLFSSPLLLGFDQFERTLDRIGKSADNYPPYNIEQLAEDRLRITLAVAGFAAEDLDIRLEANQLTIRGKQPTRESACFCTAALPPGSSSAASCWPTASRSRVPIWP